MVMPWSSQGADEERFRAILFILVIIAVVFIIIAKMWRLPPRDVNKAVEIPQRMVELVKKKQTPPPEPKPVLPKPEKKDDAPVEKKDEPKAEQPKAKKEEPKEPAPVPEQVPPPPVDTQQIRAKAETKGVLAFKNNFADLLQETAPKDADARISNSGKQAVAGPQSRSIITAQAGSGGISTATLSRQGVGSGQGIASPKMEFAQVESGLGGGKAGRGATGRTEEEYLVVLDRYKSAIDRLYQRELRNDPTLSGKLMLSITIEPDGRVSLCKVKSSDLASPTLEADVVDRVSKINFGAKEGVATITILFPIDFKPSS
jgi:outer membrane biosynthesis protein TonB